MYRLKTAALLCAATAISPTLSFAQTQNDCDLLLVEIDRRQGQELPLAREQVLVFAQRSDFQACREALQQLTAAGGQGEGSNIVVQQPAPTVTVDPATPQVSVQQRPPSVLVRQPQPEILVRQPAPVVTVDIPQPEIVVRMPPPEVIVQQAQPVVQVEQAPPEVQVVQPEQPQVNVQEGEQPIVSMRQAEGQANVTVEPIGQPRVSYERAEPQVTVNPAPGEPRISVEQTAPAAGQPSAEQDAAALRDSADPNQTAEAREGEAVGDGQQAAATQAGVDQTAEQADMRRITAAELEGMDVVNARGEQIGEAEGLVRSLADNKVYLVMDHGGFLGLGEKRVALTLEGMRLQGDRIVVPGVSDDDIRAFPAFEANDQFPRLSGDEAAEISVLAQQ